MGDISNIKTAKSLARYAAGRKATLVRVDPRLRIILAVIFSVFVVSLNNLAVLTVTVGFAAILLLMAALPLATTIKRVLAMDGFIIFMLVMLPFTMKGEPFYVLFGYEASKEGLLRAIEIALKANAAVLSLMALVGSMESVTFGHALYRLKVPENLVLLLLFTVRYIDVMHQEYDKLRRSMKTRCFRPGNNWHTYKTFGYLVGMMLVRALERSERILSAMKCRGFTGHFPLLSQFKIDKHDIVFMSCFMATILLLLYMELSNAISY